MDFQTLAQPEAGVAGINADALIVIVPATGDLPSYGGPVDAVLADALKAGDLERKAGHCVGINVIVCVERAGLYHCTVGVPD